MKSFTAAIMTILAVTAHGQLVKAPRGSGVQARGTANIRLCADQDFGSCSSFSIPTGTCWNFPADLNDVVSSVNTSSACTFYVDGSCGGDSWATSGEQATVPTNFNDDLSSVNCD